MERLLQEIERLESFIPEYKQAKPAVSDKAVGWHIEHSLKVMHGIIVVLGRSDPATYQPSFNFYKTVLFPLNWFPRGKARAPKAVQPVQSSPPEKLREYFTGLRNELETVSAFHPDHHFSHPYLGVLRVEESVKFMRLHTHHHLKIIRDILR